MTIINARQIDFFTKIYYYIFFNSFNFNAKIEGFFKSQLFEALQEFFKFEFSRQKLRFNFLAKIGENPNFKKS